MAEEKKIVAGVGSAGGKTRGGNRLSGVPQSSEEAMAAAVRQAIAEGITDQDEIRRRQLEARKKFNES